MITEKEERELKKRLNYWEYKKKKEEIVGNLLFAIIVILPFLICYALTHSTHRDYDISQKEYTEIITLYPEAIKTDSDGISGEVIYVERAIHCVFLYGDSVSAVVSHSLCEGIIEKVYATNDGWRYQIALSDGDTWFYETKVKDKVKPFEEGDSCIATIERKYVPNPLIEGANISEHITRIEKAV